MVVNAMMVAMAANANQPCYPDDDDQIAIYQVGSSVSNPIRFTGIQDYGLRYFTSNPWIGKDGKPIKVGKVTVLSSMDSFHRYLAIHYLLPLKVCLHAWVTFAYVFRSISRDIYSST